jgi:hypothetical protein
MSRRRRCLLLSIAAVVVGLAVAGLAASNAIVACNPNRRWPALQAEPPAKLVKDRRLVYVLHDQVAIAVLFVENPLSHAAAGQSRKKVATRTARPRRSTNMSTATIAATPTK